MAQYKFSNDWFKDGFQAPWKHVMSSIKAKHCLEVGCYEGRATVFMIEHETVEEIVCIDTWEGSIEHSTGGISSNENKEKIDMATVEANFDHNVNLACRQKSPEPTVHKLKGSSRHRLSELNTRPELVGYFDLIYIDGDHSAKGVLADATMAWPLLRIGGIMIFDDYLWGDINLLQPLTAPKLGIDSFINAYKDETRIVAGMPLYQLFVEKAQNTASGLP